MVVYTLGVYSPVYRPGYTPGTYRLPMSLTYSGEDTAVRGEETLGSEKEKPMGGGITLRIVLSFLLGLVGNSAHCYSALRGES